MQTPAILANFTNINDLIGYFTQLGDPMAKGIVITTFLFAALQCFFGYKLLKLCIQVCGFFSFGIFGGVIAKNFTDSQVVITIISLLFALLGTFIAFKLYKVGVFILCGSMGFLLGYVVMQNVLLGIIIAIIVGTLSVIFLKPVVIISTSVSSGLLSGLSLVTILGQQDNLILGTILGILFAAGGLFVQFTTNKESIITN